MVQYRMFASMSLFSLCVHTPTCDDTSVLCGLGELGKDIQRMLMSFTFMT